MVLVLYKYHIIIVTSSYNRKNEMFFYLQFFLIFQKYYVLYNLTKTIFLKKVIFHFQQYLSVNQDIAENY